ncbi:MAG: M14 family metallopeptidase [Bacteroidales bacterium]|nr:M14 family metallopeptidase [Bacteroidales bacterium]
MIQTVISENLPVDERLIIKKNSIGTKGGKRVCIVTGIHGDELEGQYVCYELMRRLKKDIHQLKGLVELYPALNPLGVDSVSRAIPTFDLDMNRIFPGNPDGHMIEYVAHRIIEDLAGADLVIDIHSSNIYLYEIPQARVSKTFADKLMPIVQMLNLDFIWVHDAATVLESTIAHSLNSIGTPTVVVEMGIGMKITKEYGDKLVDGIINVLDKFGMWGGDLPVRIHKPIVSTIGDVCFINANYSGVIINTIPNLTRVSKGDVLCQIVSSLTGDVLENVEAPVDGLLFTMRSYPIVYEGSLLARIFYENNPV